MKSLILLLCVFSFSAFANQIVDCTSVQHHGSYLDITIENNKLKMETSYDSDEVIVWENITVDSGQGIIPTTAGQSWAIRNAVNLVSEGQGWGNVVIKAKSGSDTLLVNINSYIRQVTMVVNDYIELATCRLSE